MLSFGWLKVGLELCLQFSFTLKGLAALFLFCCFTVLNFHSAQAYIDSTDNIDDQLVEGFLQKQKDELVNYATPLTSTQPLVLPNTTVINIKTQGHPARSLLGLLKFSPVEVVADGYSLLNIRSSTDTLWPVYYSSKEGAYYTTSNTSRVSTNYNGVPLMFLENPDTLIPTTTYLSFFPLHHLNSISIVPGQNGGVIYGNPKGAGTLNLESNFMLFSPQSKNYLFWSIGSNQQKQMGGALSAYMFGQSLFSEIDFNAQTPSKLDIVPHKSLFINWSTKLKLHHNQSIGYSYLFHRQPNTNVELVFPTHYYDHINIVGSLSNTLELHQLLYQAYFHNLSIKNNTFYYKYQTHIFMQKTKYTRTVSPPNYAVKVWGNNLNLNWNFSSNGANDYLLIGLDLLHSNQENLYYSTLKNWYIPETSQFTLAPHILIRKELGPLFTLIGGRLNYIQTKLKLFNERSSYLEPLYQDLLKTDLTTDFLNTIGLDLGRQSQIWVSYTHSLIETDPRTMILDIRDTANYTYRYGNTGVRPEKYISYEAGAEYKIPYSHPGPKSSYLTLGAVIFSTNRTATPISLFNLSSKRTKKSMRTWLNLVSDNTEGVEFQLEQKCYNYLDVYLRAAFFKTTATPPPAVPWLKNLRKTAEINGDKTLVNNIDVIVKALESNYSINRRKRFTAGISFSPNDKLKINLEGLYTNWYIPEGSAIEQITLQRKNFDDNYYKRISSNKLALYLDCSLSYKIKHWEWILGIHNALNEKYYVRVNYARQKLEKLTLEPGRNYILTLKYEL